ncbi:MAG: VOC family protein [Bacteriovoracaceae bacterium]|nr:VOC family protein [Bacteriovoracaceae bacterium]
MRINHLILGCDNIDESRKFYETILGFKFIDSFIDTGTRNQGYVLVIGQEHELEILLVPFKAERLPSPQHLALEVDSLVFKRILKESEEHNLDIRSMPPLDCKIKGVGITEVRGRKFERFYLLDPARINIEIMREI